MFESRYCPECNAEVVIRYHIPDKNFVITDGKIVRDDAWVGQPEILFECSNDREHDVPMFTKWEDPITKEFYKGAYYE
jgi:hypothetical protein